MLIRYFDLEHDFEILNNWLKVHGHDLVHDYELPKLGYVAVKDNEMVAIGFLRLCEGNFAMIDSFTLSPYTKSLKSKGEAFDAITSKLIKLAKDLKISYLLAYSVKRGVINRSVKKHGFIKSDHTLLVKKIN